jgi:hypothetical protein
MYQEFLKGFLENFDDEHSKALGESVAQLGQSLKNSKIRFNETYKGWDFAKTGRGQHRTPERITPIKSSKLSEVDKNQYLSPGSLSSKHKGMKLSEIAKERSGRKYLKDLSSEEEKSMTKSPARS